MSSEALEQIWKDVAYAGLRKGSFVRGGGVETVARRHVEFNMEATVVSGVTPFAAVECTKGSTERRGYRTIPNISKSRTKKPSSMHLRPFFVVPRAGAEFFHRNNFIKCVHCIGTWYTNGLVHIRCVFPSFFATIHTHSDRIIFAHLHWRLRINAAIPLCFNMSPQYSVQFSLLKLAARPYTPISNVDDVSVRVYICGTLRSVRRLGILTAHL